jgi:phage shock protein PspC (stress-responsive transcriptional regulator)
MEVSLGNRGAVNLRLHHDPHQGIGSCRGGGALQDLHPFVDYQCCAAKSHLQHEAKIPNSWREKVVGIAKPAVRISVKLLKLHFFSEWHVSCYEEGKTFCRWSEFMETQETNIALPLRSHTILGVCEAIGEDFGFNPVILRVPFAASVLWSPTWAIGAYLALGLVVLASRLLFPKTKPVESERIEAENPAPFEQQEFAKAA